MEEQKTENGECFGEMPHGAPQGTPRRTARGMPSRTPQGMLQEMARGMPTGF